MAFLKRSGKIQFWLRPLNLTRHTSGGNGPFVFVRLEMDMEAEATKKRPVSKTKKKTDKKLSVIELYNRQRQEKYG